MASFKLGLVLVLVLVLVLIVVLILLQERKQFVAKVFDTDELYDPGSATGAVEYQLNQSQLVHQIRKLGMLCIICRIVRFSRAVLASRNNFQHIA